MEKTEDCPPNLDELILSVSQEFGSCIHKSTVCRHLDKFRKRICDHIIKNELPILSTMYLDGIEKAKERRELKPNAPVTQEYWMSTIGIFAASDMLEVNIIVCDERFEWQLHNGTIRDGIDNMHEIRLANNPFGQQLWKPLRSCGPCEFDLIIVFLDKLFVVVNSF